MPLSSTITVLRSLSDGTRPAPIRSMHWLTTF